MALRQPHRRLPILALEVLALPDLDIHPHLRLLGRPDRHSGRERFLQLGETASPAVATARGCP